MRSFHSRLLVAIAGILFCAAGIWNLERARSGLTITPITVGSTPATTYQLQNTGKAPAIVIAHGFAGSRQLMEAYALTLAQAGYIIISFDFEGHGRNPTPMTGDVTHVDGTTQVLKREVRRIVDAALSLPSVDGRVALLGHSMASDIIVREAVEDPRVSATITISMFSEAVTKSEPRNLLMISGEWESFLRAYTLQIAQLTDPAAKEGETVIDPSTSSRRRTFVAPHVEHVSVLYSSQAIHDARDWLDEVFGRKSKTPIVATGGWIVILLTGIFLLAWPLAGLLARIDCLATTLPLRTFLLATLLPAALTPPLLTLVDTRFLPILVADYLAAHLFVFGIIALGVLTWKGVRLKPIALASAAALAAYGILIFGFALDRYVASFMPNPARAQVIAIIAVGSVPYMVSDALAVDGGRAPYWRMFLVRGAFLASLGAAVLLNFERLFFLLIIIPIIILFFIVFGTVGGWVARRTMSPVAAGIGLGLILAWSIGVSFPMFSPG